jgi:hypothetical protein
MLQVDHTVSQLKEVGFRAFSSLLNVFLFILRVIEDKSTATEMVVIEEPSTV